jgi:hypothetical protein
MNRDQVIEELKSLVNDRIAISKKAMDGIQEAINSESKSTAGDKHDTSRELLQQERNKAAQNLDQLIRIKSVFGKLDQVKDNSKVGFGSLMKTDLGWIFIGLPLGKVNLQSGEELICISAVSPMAKKLMSE